MFPDNFAVLISELDKDFPVRVYLLFNDDDTLTFADGFSKIEFLYC